VYIDCHAGTMGSTGLNLHGTTADVTGPNIVIHTGVSMMTVVEGLFVVRGSTSEPRTMGWGAVVRLA
jgi:hypothetical protein